MPTNGFSPDYPLPLFLAGEPEQQDVGKAWDRAVFSSRVLKAGILVTAATAIAMGIAVLSVGNPMTLFANVPALADVTASVVDKSALQLGPDQSTPTIQSTADAQPLAVRDAPTRDEIAAASESAGQSQSENSESSSEALFREFQAWAAEKDAHPQVGPVQSVQEVAENARAHRRPMQKNRNVRPLPGARAEIRHARKKLRRAAQDARAQDQSVQNAQAPSFLQTFGWRNWT
jgi:hypothetical protein